MMGSLFARTSLTLSAALLLFILMTGFVVFNYILMPLGKQSANDLASLMVLAVKTWSKLPNSAQKSFAQELAQEHELQLQVQAPPAPLQNIALMPPYLIFLQQALQDHFQNVQIQQERQEPDQFWIQLYWQGQRFYIGLHHQHIGAQPPRAVIFILFSASLFILITTLLIVRRITQPLSLLSQAVQKLGKGETDSSLPETGPEEFAQLSRKFNQMSREIQQLLENRTTLLGGISHDLRTPLARLRLVIELLQGKEEPQLLQKMQRYLDEMEQLIQRTLELARLMKADEKEVKTIKLNHFLSDLAQKEGIAFIDAAPPIVIELNPMLLERILHNLIQNALIYGKAPVELHLQMDAENIQICVLDRGPGIPRDQIEQVMQPFYRLDAARNLNQGGSGLGLAIVKQLAQIQAWSIQLHNRSDGGLAACLYLLNDSGRRRFYRPNHDQNQEYNKS